MPKWRNEAILDVYTLVLATFLFATPWLFAFGNELAGVEIWASSFLLALASSLAIVAFVEWEEWMSLLLGVWIAMAPWALGFQHTSAMKVSVGVGCVVAFLAALELWLIHYASPHTTEAGPSAIRHET